MNHDKPTAEETSALITRAFEIGLRQSTDETTDTRRSPGRGQIASRRSWVLVSAAAVATIAIITTTLFITRWQSEPLSASVTSGDSTRVVRECDGTVRNYSSTPLDGLTVTPAAVPGESILHNISVRTRAANGQGSILILSSNDSETVIGATGQELDQRQLITLQPSASATVTFGTRPFSACSGQMFLDGDYPGLFVIDTDHGVGIKQIRVVVGLGVVTWRS